MRNCARERERESVCVFVYIAKSKGENSHIEGFKRYWFVSLLDVMNGKDYIL